MRLATRGADDDQCLRSVLAYADGEDVAPGTGRGSHLDSPDGTLRDDGPARDPRVNPRVVESVESRTLKRAPGRTR